MNSIPIIPESKNYWLIRTQGGKYYSDFRIKGIIAINWNNVVLSDILELSAEKLSEKVKKEYPDIIKPGRAASQMKIFANNIKKGDTVVITSYASNKFTIGEVEEDECFEEDVNEQAMLDNPKLTPYKKRKKVRWIKEVHKWDVEMPMFKLLQHARNTINSANEYGDVIESMLHDFYIRGNSAQLSLSVKKEGKIVAPVFFSLGTEILELIQEFSDYSQLGDIDINEIETKINVNSPGKIKLVGPTRTILIAGLLIVVCITGGGVTVPLPESLGLGDTFELQTNGLLREFTDFMDHKQARDQKELLLKQYMNELEVETPDELTKLLNAVSIEEEPKE